FLKSVQQLFGAPGDNSTIGHRIAGLAEAADALAVTPESATVRGQTIEAAINVARQIGDMADSIQDLRRDADREIKAAVETVNTQLQRIAELNGKIKHAQVQGIPAGELEDQRDLALATLTREM